LTEVTHEESLDAAINGLRNWLPQSPKNGELLKEELVKVYRNDDAETVYRLLWGFNKDDAQNRDTSLQLVNWLEHDELVVRQLAFYHIRRLTGQKYNYRADLSPTQRAAFARRMRTTVENADGLVRKSGVKLPN
jgi:hypothetical protein